MLILPYGDDNPTKGKPLVTYLLIFINVIIFLAFGFSKEYRQIVMTYGFIPSQAAPVTYFTSLFLHGSIFHLLGNMLYLYIVGDNVEDKLGHLGYAVFYLLTGAAANFFHMHLISDQMLSIPTIGASGAVSGILGAYLLMFPRNRINFFYFFWIIIFIRWGTFKLASFWAIGMWFVMQLFSHAASSGYSPVAYGAHIGGFLMAFFVLGPLILTGMIKVFWHREQTVMDIAGEAGDLPPGTFMPPGEPMQESRPDGSYRVTWDPRKESREDDYWK